MLKASFIPGKEQQAVRDLTRTRMRLIQERTCLINRIQADYFTTANKQKIQQWLVH